MLKVISSYPSIRKISEETVHQAKRDLTGCMATHQEMRAQSKRTKYNTCKYQKLKKILISLLIQVDVICKMRLTSPDSRKFTMLQKRDQSTRTRLKKARDAISSTLRMSRCQLSDLTSSNQKRRTIQLPWKKSAKTLPALLLRSWMLKSGKACSHPPLACRCASECSEHVVLQRDPDSCDKFCGELCLTHFFSTRKKLVRLHNVLIM